MPDGHVNAKNVLALLVDDGVGGDDRLTGLAVADDQFALAPADGDHGVNGLDARLQGHGHLLALDDAGGIAFNGAHFPGINGALAVDGLAQGLAHAADHRFADRHGHHLAGAFHGIALADALVGAQHNDGHGIFLQVQGHAEFAVGELHQLVGHALIQTGGTGDAVADHDDGAGVALGDFIAVMLDLFFDQL